MECVTSLLFLRGKFGKLSDIRCTCIRTKYFGLRQKTRFLVSKLFKFFFRSCAVPLLVTAIVRLCFHSTILEFTY